MPRLPALDSRLACAAELFPACAYGADIGADHGRLSCFLLASGRCQGMCVSDISPDSLAKAQRLLTLHRLADRADFQVGYGLDALPHPADAVAVLGMGGHTLSAILRSGKDRLNGACLVLSAHTDVPLVRQTVEEIGYRISEERIVFDGRRYYILLQAKPGAERLNAKQRLIGPKLMERMPRYYPEYLRWRINVTGCERSKDAQRALEMLKEEYTNACHGENDRSTDAADRSL